MAGQGQVRLNYEEMDSFICEGIIEHYYVDTLSTTK